jgi:tetratricopeptide (TPR) repeat protein
MRLAAVARDRGAFGEAERLYDEALHLRRAAGDRTGVAHVLSNLGWLAFYARDHARARALQEESLAIRRAGDDPREIAISLMALARVAVADGDQPAARDHLREGLPLLREVGDRWGIALCLEATAGLLARSDPARALYLAGAADALRVAIARPLPPSEHPIVDAWLEEARRALGAAGSDALAAGAAAPLAAVVAGLDADLGGPPAG